MPSRVEGMARDLHHSSILLAYSALLPCVVNSRGRRSWSRTSPEEHARPDSESYSNARTGWSPHMISLRGMIPLPPNLVFKDSTGTNYARDGVPFHDAMHGYGPLPQIASLGDDADN